MEQKDPRRNSEGYLDLTPHDAIRNIEKEKREADRFYRLLKHIFYVCDLAGFDVEGRISLKDRRTGRVWK